MAERRARQWRVTSGAAGFPVRTARGVDDAVIEVEIGTGDTVRSVTATILARSGNTCVVAIDGRSTRVHLVPRDGGGDAMVEGEAFTVSQAAETGAESDAGHRPRSAAARAAAKNEAARTAESDAGHRPRSAEPPASAALDPLAAPMPATVSAILVRPGASVETGDTLLRLEAMKMELAIRASSSGRVATVDCRVGDLVQPGRPLVTLDPEATTCAKESHGTGPQPGRW